MVGVGVHQDTNQEGDHHDEELSDPTTRARTTGRTTPKKAKARSDRAAHEAALALPDTVTVAIGELTGELEEGLLAFVVARG